MNLCKATNTSLYFKSVKDIPEDIWNSLGCEKSIYFTPNYLYSLEKNNPHIHFCYLVLTNSKEEPIAFASIQIIDFYFDDIEDVISKNLHQLKCFGRRLGLLKKQKPIKVLVCGNIFVSGEHGVFIKESQNKQEVIKDLAKAILELTKSKKENTKDISIFLIKDFIKESLTISDELHDLNYYSFNVEPNMKMEIQKDWNSFEDYLASMRTKFRVKAKRALKLSGDLVVKNSSLEELKKILPDITTLYKTVSDKAAFNLSDFDAKTFLSLKEKLGENYILKTYWYHQKLVGFMSGLITNNSLDAHYVGIDYTLNKELAIYQRMLYDYIQIAIHKNLKEINFGRTAGEIKSSIGAVSQDLTCYIRHKKTLTNKFLKHFLHYIESKPFKQHYPFKEKTATN